MYENASNATIILLLYAKLIAIDFFLLSFRRLRKLLHELQVGW